MVACTRAEHPRRLYPGGGQAPSTVVGELFPEQHEADRRQLSFYDVMKAAEEKDADDKAPPPRTTAAAF